MFPPKSCFVHTGFLNSWYGSVAARLLFSTLAIAVTRVCSAMYEERASEEVENVLFTPSLAWNGGEHLLK